MKLPKPFHELTSRGQIARMRAFAPEASKALGVEPGQVKLLNHGFNTTFKVIDVKGRPYALRMNLDSIHDRNGILAELQWVRALAASEDGFRVPEPVSDAIFTFDLPGADRKIDCVMYHWLEGPDIGNRATPVICEAIGRALGDLHRHALTFELKSPAHVREMPDLLWGAPLRLSDDDLPLEPLKIALARGEAVQQKLRDREPARLIHGDVHFGNTKWIRKKLAVFDFDDCVFAWPENDLGITLFYLRGQKRAKECEIAFREGFGPIAISDDDLEALIACRAVLLANELSTSTNAAIQAWMPTYYKRTTARLKGYLETGFFDTSAGKEASET